MKKNVSILIALMLIFSLTSVFAEEVTIKNIDAEFNLVFSMPEGIVETSSYSADYYTINEYAYEDQDNPSFDITTGPSELYIGKTLDELSQEDLDTLIADLTAEMSDSVVELKTTAKGYTYLIANESTEYNDVSQILMLYKGFFIEVGLYWQDFRELSEKDLDIATTLVESFEFISVE